MTTVSFDRRVGVDRLRFAANAIDGLDTWADSDNADRICPHEMS